jgi:hypothetical protein
MARRNFPKRKLRDRIAVLGDGRTEQYYLQHLKQIKGYKYAIKPPLFNSVTLRQAGKIIDNLLDDEYALVIFLTDFDTIIAQNRTDEFNAFKKRYEDKGTVLICESMPSIEFWFLLHYIKTTREFPNADKVFKALKKHLTAFDKKESYLEKPDWVSELMADNKLETAINHSKKILEEKLSGNAGDHFPLSKIHLAIEKFEAKK